MGAVVYEWNDGRELYQNGGNGWFVDEKSQPCCADSSWLNRADGMFTPAGGCSVLRLGEKERIARFLRAHSLWGSVRDGDSRKGPREI